MRYIKFIFQSTFLLITFLAMSCNSTELDEKQPLKLDNTDDGVVNIQLGYIQQCIAESDVELGIEAKKYLLKNKALFAVKSKYRDRKKFQYRFNLFFFNGEDRVKTINDYKNILNYDIGKHYGFEAKTTTHNGIVYVALPVKMVSRFEKDYNK